MTLSEYLRSRDLTQSEFALQHGLSQTMVSALCRGTLSATLRMVRRVVDATGGTVTAQEIFDQAVRHAAACEYAEPSNPTSETAA